MLLNLAEFRGGEGRRSSELGDKLCGFPASYSDFPSEIQATRLE